MKPITKIELSGTEYSTAVSCEYDGARFHVWLNPKTLQPNGDATLYKNSIPDRGDPGYFDTRKLDQKGATGRVLVPVMLAEVKKLKPALDAKRKMDAAHQEADWEDSRREEAIKKAAPAMLKALKSLSESSQWIASTEVPSDEQWKAFNRSFSESFEAIKKAEAIS